MKYLLKENQAEEIRKKYKNAYISEITGLSMCYVSLILNRRREVPKRIAYVFTKAINRDYEINELFDLVR